MKTFMVAVLGIAVLILAGCVSPYKERSGQYIKPVSPQFRDLFGTNMAFARLERCDGPTKAVFFYMQSDFSNCVLLTRSEQDEWVHGFSQGQGGQIFQGITTLTGFGWLAEANAGSSIVNNASSSTILNIRGHYGK